MPLSEQSKVISGHTFKVATLPASKAWEVAGKLGRFFGPAVGGGLTAYAGAAGKKGLLDMDLMPVGGAITKFLSGVSDPEFPAFIKELCTTGVTMDGKQLTDALYETVFAADLAGAAELASFSVEVSLRIPLGSLVNWIRTFVADMQAAAKTAREKATTTTALAPTSPPA